MISMTAIDYDPAGVVLLPSAYIENTYSAARRGSITATLDGGVAVYDSGFSESDIPLTARIRKPGAALLATLRYLVSHYSRIRLSCESGCYVVALSVTVSGAEARLEFRIISRLDE